MITTHNIWSLIKFSFTIPENFPEGTNNDGNIIIELPTRDEAGYYIFANGLGRFTKFNE